MTHGYNCVIVDQHATAQRVVWLKLEMTRERNANKRMAVNGEKCIVHPERNAFLDILMGTDDERQSICFHEALRLLLPKDHQFGWSFLSIIRVWLLLQYRNRG